MRRCDSSVSGRPAARPALGTCSSLQALATAIEVHYESLLSKSLLQYTADTSMHIQACMRQAAKDSLSMTLWSEAPEHQIELTPVQRE